jgi:hypothetical protein
VDVDINYNERDDSGRITLLDFVAPAYVVARFTSRDSGYAVEIKGRQGRQYQVRTQAQLSFELNEEIVVRVHSSSKDGMHYLLRVKEIRDSQGKWHPNLGTIIMSA